MRDLWAPDAHGGSYSEAMNIWMVVVPLLALVVGIVSGWFAGVNLGAGRALDSLRMRVSQAEHERDMRGEQTRAVHDQLRQRLEEAHEQLADERERSERMRVEYEDRLADQAQRSLGQQKERARIMEALVPVSDMLTKMTHSMSAMERSRAEEYGVIRAQLEASTTIGEQLRVTTSQLHDVMGSTSVRGQWGEIQLRRLVDMCGLMEHVDFDEQDTQRCERNSGEASGRQRPDMVVHLPQGRTLIIDSKVPFDAYMKACDIPDSAGEREAEQKKKLLAQHVRAVRSHVDTLSKKEYWKRYEQSPDLVIAFIPLESLLSAALREDPQLLEYAFSRGVALASPSALWACLKAVAYTWREESAVAQVREFYALASELYSRLCTLADHAELVRKTIDDLTERWNRFVGSLETRVLVSARKMSQLDESHVIVHIEPVEKKTRSLRISDQLSGEKGEQMS